MTQFNWGKTAGSAFMLFVVCGGRAWNGPWSPPWSRWVDGVIAGGALVLYLLAQVREERDDREAR